MPSWKGPLNVAELRKPPESPTIDDVQGPLQRVMQAKFRNPKTKDSRSPADIAAERAEFDFAKELYDAGEYAKAEKALKRFSKTHKIKHALRSTKRSYQKFDRSPIREEALFLLAESQFHLKRYPKAQDNYELLMKAYPSTRYMNQSTKQLFAIARDWLGFPEFATVGDVQQVNLEEPDKNDSVKRDKPPHSNPILPNFFDRSRPVFDTTGRALAALKAIWLNDPTGSLADDALMLTASHHLRTGNHMEASRNFTLLREEYPKSEHLQAAFVLGSHVKLMSYQGEAYDAKVLDEAEKLKQSTLRLFPNIPERERIEKELRTIYEAKAKRDWSLVEFYQRKKNQRAIAVYCKEIIRNYPASSYAVRAQELLSQIQPALGDSYEEDEPVTPRYDDEESPASVPL